MTHSILPLILLALMFIGVVAAPGATASGRPNPNVYVIGDSITAMMAKSAEKPEGWRMDGFAGRRITSLGQPYTVRTTDYWTGVSHVFNPRVTRRVNTVVIALGTNGADVDLTVAQAEDLYRAGIAQIRDQDIWRAGAKRIVLVTPYRRPSIDADHVSPRGQAYEPYQWAPKMGAYAAAMRSIAAADRDVCLMPWRAVASKHPGLLRDGTHPNARGRKVWRDLAIKAVRGCH